MGALQPTAAFALRRGLESKYDSAELITLADQVDDLLEHPAWKAISELLEGGAENILTDLKRGAPKEATEYAKTMGYLSGLEEFPSAILTIKEASARVQAGLDQQAEADRRRQEVAA